MFFQHYGVVIGGVLLTAVTACAVLLGRQAAKHVEQFREERHERYSGSKKP